MKALPSVSVLEEGGMMLELLGLEAVSCFALTTDYEETHVHLPPRKHRFGLAMVVVVEDEVYSLSEIDLCSYSARSSTECDAEVSPHVPIDIGVHVPWLPRAVAPIPELALVRHSAPGRCNCFVCSLTLLPLGID